MPDTGEQDPGARRGLTYADYAALPDDGRRYQLVEGELVVTPSPFMRHQKIVLEIAVQVRAHVDRAQLGEVAVGSLDVILDDHNVLQPDLLFVSRDRMDIAADWVRGAPDLCVEVVSTGSVRLDRLKKMELYARFGVPHYWIVDPEAQRIEEYVLQQDVYGARSVARFGEAFRPALFPDLELLLTVS